MSQRLLDVLAAFADRPEMTAAELSEHLALPISTVFRLVRTLQDYGMLTASAGCYGIGPRIRQLVDASISGLDVASVAAPAMETLASACGETVLLTTLAGDQAVSVHVAPGSEAFRFSYAVGVARPLHAGASAKILFAYMDAKQRARLLGGGSFTRRTELTVTDPKALERELEQIRSQGYALTSGEWEADATSAAAPIRAQRGVWGLSIVAPTFRVNRTQAAALVTLVVEAAAQVSRSLTGRIRPDARQTRLVLSGKAKHLAAGARDHGSTQRVRSSGP